MTLYGVCNVPSYGIGWSGRYVEARHGSVDLSSRTVLAVYSFTLVLPPPTTPDTTTTGPVSSATPVTTGTTQPPSGEIQ